MAQRLATEYVNTCLQLTEAELSNLFQPLQEQQLLMQVKVFENGSQEVAVQDMNGEHLLLAFEKRAGFYVWEGTCRLSNPKLVNVMRKLVSTYKGNAVVNRIYPTFTMIYHYTQGTVTKIIEQCGEMQKIVYQSKDTTLELRELFARKRVEAEIEAAQVMIDELLDRRNRTNESDELLSIDEHMQRLSHKLFVLEA